MVGILPGGDAADTRQLARLPGCDRPDSRYEAGLGAFAEQRVDRNHDLDLHLRRLRASHQQVDQGVRAALVHRADIIGVGRLGNRIGGVVDLACLDRGRSAHSSDTPSARGVRVTRRSAVARALRISAAAGSAATTRRASH